jgi:hypothetical protein
MRDLYGARMIRLPVVLLVLASAAGAHGADLQQMMATAGEWQVTISGMGPSDTTQRACYRGARSIAELTTAQLDGCSRKTVNVGQTVATIDAQCMMSGVPVNVRGRLVPTGESSIRGESRITPAEELPPLLQGLDLNLNVTFSARRLGPCAAGERSF